MGKDSETGKSGIGFPREPSPPPAPPGTRSRAERSGNRPVRVFLALLFLSALLPVRSSAWVYPEHRDIAVQAVQSLDPEEKAVLHRLWEEARSGHEGRLCGQPAERSAGRRVRRS